MPSNDSTRTDSITQKIEQDLAFFNDEARQRLSEFLKRPRLVCDAILLGRSRSVDFEAVASRSAKESSMELLSIDFGSNHLGPFVRFAPESAPELHHKIFGLYGEQRLFIETIKAFIENPQRATSKPGQPILVAFSGLGHAGAEAQHAAMELIDTCSKDAARFVVDGVDSEKLRPALVDRCRKSTPTLPDIPPMAISGKLTARRLPSEPAPASPAEAFQWRARHLGAFLGDPSSPVGALADMPPGTGFDAMAKDAAKALGLSCVGIQIERFGGASVHGQVSETRLSPGKVDLRELLTEILDAAASGGGPFLLAVSGIMDAAPRDAMLLAELISQRHEQGVRIVVNAPEAPDLHEKFHTGHRTLFERCARLDVSPSLQARPSASAAKPI